MELPTRASHSLIISLVISLANISVSLVIVQLQTRELGKAVASWCPICRLIFTLESILPLGLFPERPLPCTGYGISPGASLNRPFEKVLIMPTDGGWWAKIKGIEIAFLAVGAVAGALLRYKLAESQLIAHTIPVSVLAANVIGSFILGIFSILFVAWNLDSRYSILAAVGFCGSLTTMSSFALETVNLADNRQFGSMAINILANVGLSIGAIVGGRSLATVI